MIIFDYCSSFLGRLDHPSMVSVFKCFYTLHTMFSASPCRYFLSNSPILIQMATWSFRDALEELELRRQFDESMLKSEVGLRLGDICFAEIQTTIKMRAVRFSTFLHYIADGSFNPDHMAPHCCSQTTAILIAFLPDWHLQDIESVGIGCVIRRFGAPWGTCHP